MVLDDRQDMYDDFNLQEKVKKLEKEVEHHKESHALANKLLMVERNKMSSMEATIKFEVAGKYNAYKDLKVASTLIFLDSFGLLSHSERLVWEAQKIAEL